MPNVERYEPEGRLKAVRFALDEPCELGEGMIFASLEEVQLAYSMGVVNTHARLKVKLPPKRKLKTEDGTLIVDPFGHEWEIGRPLGA